jgi:hypothetical protein
VFEMAMPPMLGASVIAMEHDGRASHRHERPWPVMRSCMPLEAVRAVDATKRRARPPHPDDPQRRARRERALQPCRQRQRVAATR